MKIPFSTFLSAMLFAGLTSTGHAGDGGSEKTREVVAHHWQTFQSNDLEGTMLDYTDDSILITPKRTYKGLKDIRDNFVSAFAKFPKSKSTLKLDKTIIERNVGYIIWEGVGPQAKLLFGTDTFLIENGKIITQTFGGVDGQP